MSRKKKILQCWTRSLSITMVLLLLLSACSTKPALNSGDNTSPTIDTMDLHSGEKKNSGEEETLDLVDEEKIIVETIADILQIDFWKKTEEEMLESLVCSGWTVYSQEGNTGHVFLKQYNGFNTALIFGCFDSGKIKSVKLQYNVRSEKLQPKMDEKMQTVKENVWNDVRMMNLISDDTDYIDLCAQWILKMRDTIQNAGGDLTEGAMHFSGVTVNALSETISSFFELEPDESRNEVGKVTSVSVGEGYFELLDGSHVQTTASFSPTAKSATFILERRCADYVDRFGNKPVPNPPDYRPNNVDAYWSITNLAKSAE